MKSKFLIAFLLLATCCSALTTPTQSYPSDGAQNLAVQISLKVNSVAGANNYQWEIDTTEAMNSPIKQSYTSFTWSYYNQAYVQSVNNLYFGTMHYWRVRACSATDTSAWSTIRRFTTLDVPTIQNPADSSTGMHATVAMYATKVDGCTNYIWEADTTPLFNSISKKHELSMQFKAATGGYVHNMGNLKFNRRYYWRIAMCNAVDTSLWSDVRWFETIANPTLIAPASDTTGLDNQVQIAVLKIDGASDYNFQISQSASFTSPTTLTSHNYEVAHTAYVDTFKNLKYNVKYYWRVRALHAEDTSAWSETRNFRVTKSAKLNSPSNGNEGDVKRQVTLTVKPIAGTTMYIWQLDTTTHFNSLALQYDTSFNWNATQKLYTQFFVGLSFGTKYYWRVKACAPNDTSVWSDVWNFTTICELPDAPELISPSDNDTISSKNPTLKWYGLANAKKYGVELADDSTFAVVVRIENTSDTIISVKGLTRNKRYFWRVYGYNDAKRSPNSEVRSFTLIGSGEAVEDVQREQTILWPNPTNGIVYLGKEQEITVTDLSGRTLVKCYANSVDLSGFPNGIYLVNRTKIVKE